MPICTNGDSFLPLLGYCSTTQSLKDAGPTNLLVGVVFELQDQSGLSSGFVEQNPTCKRAKLEGPSTPVDLIAEYSCV